MMRQIKLQLRWNKYQVGLSHKVKVLKKVFATLQQVNTAIQDVTGSAESISISSLHARERAEEGEDLVEQTAKQMQSISRSVSESDAIIKLLDEKSKQVGAISEAIQNIATQTNLLALNAAIEAKKSR